VSGLVFIFYASWLILGSTKGVRFSIHVLRSKLIFGDIKAVGSCFIFYAPRLILTVPSAPGSVCIFYAPKLVFSGTKGVKSNFHIFVESFLSGTEGTSSSFHVIHSWTRVRWYRGHRVLRSPSRFLWYRGHPVSFSCFALPDSFSAVLWVSSPVFILCALELVFGGTVGVESYFHALRSRI
jgi:hypothetical protein